MRRRTARSRRAPRPPPGAAKTSTFFIHCLGRARRTSAAEQRRAPARGRRPPRPADRGSGATPRRCSTVRSVVNGFADVIGWPTPRRHTARGRCRKAHEHSGSTPGRPHDLLARREAPATASATAPGWWRTGRGSIPRSSGADPAGPHDEDPDAGADQRVAEPLGERVEPGLGRAVDEVRLADPLAGHRAEARRSCRGPAACEPAGHVQQRRHRPDVVGGDGLGRRGGIVVEVRLGRRARRRRARRRRRRRRPRRTRPRPLPWPAMSRASQATSSPPRRRRPAAGRRPAPSPRAGARRARPCGSRRAPAAAVAAPRSDAPPSTSSDWTAPSTFCTSGEGSG